MIEILAICSGWFIFAIIEFCAKDSAFHKSKNYRVIYFMLSLALILLCGFRPVGVDRDIEMYKKYFQEFSNLPYHTIFFDNTHRVKEIGYILLNKIFNHFGFRNMVIFISAVTVGIKSVIFYKYSRLPVFANVIYISMFFFLREYTQIRDALAITFLILSFIYYYYNKKLYTVLFIAIAASFHLIALISVPILLCLHFVKEEKYYYYLLPAGFILLFVNPVQYITLLDLPHQILKYNYIPGGGSMSVIFLGILSIGYYYGTNSVTNNTSDPMASFYFKLSSLAVFFGFLTLNHPALFRITNFLMFFSILLVSNSLALNRHKFAPGSFFIMLVVLLYLFSKSLFNGLLLVQP